MKGRGEPVVLPFALESLPSMLTRGEKELAGCELRLFPRWVRFLLRAILVVGGGSRSRTEIEGGQRKTPIRRVAAVQTLEEGKSGALSPDLASCSRQREMKQTRHGLETRANCNGKVEQQLAQLGMSNLKYVLDWIADEGNTTFLDHLLVCRQARSKV